MHRTRIGKDFSNNMNEALLEVKDLSMQFGGVRALHELSFAVKKNEMNMSSVALRWIMHHSKLKSSFGDAVILGASNTEHLSTNINSCKETPLDKNIQGILEYAWDICSADCPDYFRN